MNAAAALIERFGNGEASVTSRAPGRVNLIGEHTDYNDGFVLPTILGCYVEVALRRRADRIVRMFAADFDETVVHKLAETPDPSWPGWTPFLVGLTEDLRARGHVDGGFDLAVCGTVPPGSGLSSSAALETAAAMALERSFGFHLDPIDMVRLCRDVEHRWAGVRCGIMDQMACRLGQPGQALLIDCDEQTYRRVPLNLEKHALILVDSGLRRRLSVSAYNERRRECETGVALLKRYRPATRSLRDVESEFLAAHTSDLPQEVENRCRHVIEENARVLAAELALRGDDMVAFGKLMTASHISLRDLFDASHPAIDRLVEEALRVPGVLGSRLTGAGWGGCTVTLCANAAVAPFRQRMEKTFEELGIPGVVMSIDNVAAAGIVEEGT